MLRVSSVMFLLALSAPPNDPAAAINKLGGSVSIQVEAGEKRFKVDFTNGTLGDEQLRAVTDLTQPCILDL